MKNFLNLKQLDTSCVKILLDLASDMKFIAQAKNKKGPQMLGKTLVCLSDGSEADFSLYQLAFQYLGGSVCLGKTDGGIADAARKYANYGASVIAVKTKKDAVLNKIADVCECPVLNCGTDESDPIQALSVLATLSFCFDTLKNKNVSLFGYKRKQFVAELIYFLRSYEANVFPFFPYEKNSIYPEDAVLFKSPEQALTDADVIIDLGADGKKDYLEYYGDANGISENLLKMAKPEIPLFFSRTYYSRGVETAYPYSLADRQEKDYIACCMAALYYSFC